jgi:hypothetical protein
VLLIFSEQMHHSILHLPFEVVQLLLLVGAKPKLVANVLRDDFAELPAWRPRRWPFTASSGRPLLIT